MAMTELKARLICPATAGCLTGVGNQLRLGPLDAISQGSAAKQGQQPAVTRRA